MGVEPTTTRLKVECSTTELPAQLPDLTGFYAITKRTCKFKSGDPSNHRSMADFLRLT